VTSFIFCLALDHFEVVLVLESAGEVLLGSGCRDEGGCLQAISNRVRSMRREGWIVLAYWLRFCDELAIVVCVGCWCS
jgi:hypothetical protein